MKAFTIGGSRDNRHFWIFEDASNNTLSLLWGIRRDGAYSLVTTYITHMQDILFSKEYSDSICLATVDDVKIERSDFVHRLKLLQGRSELLTFESPDRELCKR